MLFEYFSPVESTLHYIKILLRFDSDIGFLLYVYILLSSRRANFKNTKYIIKASHTKAHIIDDFKSKGTLSFNILIYLLCIFHVVCYFYGHM